MRTVLQALGIITYFFAWPAYWVYFRRNVPRTRVVVQHDGKILMVKQWISDGRWQLPGGGLHPGEDPAVGAAREVFEETNIKIEPQKLKLLGQGSQRTRGLTFEYYAYSFQASDAGYKKQNIELSDAQWLPISALNTVNTRPDAIASIQMLK